MIMMEIVSKNEWIYLMWKQKKRTYWTHKIGLTRIPVNRWNTIRPQVIDTGLMIRTFLSTDLIFV